MSVVKCNVQKANLILAHFSPTMYFGSILFVILCIYYIKDTRTNFAILTVTFYFFRPSKIVYERFFNDENSEKYMQNTKHYAPNLRVIRRSDL